MSPANHDFILPLELVCLFLSLPFTVSIIPSAIKNKRSKSEHSCLALFSEDSIQSSILGNSVNCSFCINILYPFELVPLYSNLSEKEFLS